MRQSSRQTTTATIASVQRYHGGNFSNEAYAYQGFDSNKYFTSDRFISLTADYQRTDGKPLKGYGLEIETECKGITNQTVYAEILQKIVFPCFPADLFKIQNDSSLRGDTSAECITQIMTKEFIRNNYSAFKLMYDTYFPAFKISATESGNCGMHCNISLGCFGRSAEVQSVAVKKLYYIINKHFNFACALLNRSTDRTEYCRRMPHDKNSVQAMDLATAGGSHGISFNLAHYTAGRIELRLVGGQKNFPCFRNTMESIFFLVDRVKALSWDDCDDLAKIFSGCNSYVYDRLKSYCRDAGTITDAQLAKIAPTVEQVRYI